MRMLRISEVAQRLGVSAMTVRLWIKAGRLRAIQPARVILIDPADLAAFENAAVVVPGPDTPHPEANA